MLNFYFSWMPNSYYIIGQCGYELFIWDALTGKVLKSFEPRGLEKCDISSISPDGNLITLNRSEDLYLYDLNSNKIIWHFNTNRMSNISINDIEYDIWREAEYTGTPVFYNITSVSWSPTGNYLASFTPCCEKEYNHIELWKIKYH